MTTREMNQIMKYLENGNIGDYVECDNRVVEITNMCGGRYLFLEDGMVSGQADQEIYAIIFLSRGGYVNEKYAGTASINI